MASSSLQNKQRLASKLEQQFTKAIYSQVVMYPLDCHNMPQPPEAKILYLQYRCSALIQIWWQSYIYHDTKKVLPTFKNLHLFCCCFFIKFLYVKPFSAILN